MAAFEYTALDRAGRARTGIIEAVDAAAARTRLEHRRWLPVRLQATAPAPTPDRKTGKPRLGATELALLTRQLATLATGTPLEEALRVLASRDDRRRVRTVLAGVHAQVVEGFPLAEAMAGQGRAFPPLYRAMVAAGERSGTLPRILERLADLLERQQQARMRLLAALAYPIALTGVAIAVVIALTVFVVPKVVEQFDSMGRSLPWLTRAVIALSDAARHGGWLLALLLALAGVALALALRRPGFRLRWDAGLLRLPLLGRMLRGLHGARMARTLAIMLDGGLPLLEGLASTVPTLGNHALRQATREMVGAIDEGASLTTAMKRTGIFPSTLLHMAASGENSGRLAPMLERAADYLDREFDAFTGTVMSLLEPAVIVLMGGVVATIVLAILLPILQFNTMVP